MIDVQKVRIEYKENPIGIDVLNPRISWQIDGSGRNLKQSAYQIQVSTDPGFTSLVWDTRKVNEAKSIHIEYQGHSVMSRTRYYVRVRV